MKFTPKNHRCFCRHSFNVPLKNHENGKINAAGLWMLESLEQPLSRSWERRGSGDGGAVVPLLFRGKGGMSPRCHRFTFHLITFKWVNQIALTETKDLKHFRAFFSGDILLKGPYKSGKHSIIVLRIHGVRYFWVSRCWPDSSNGCFC